MTIRCDTGLYVFEMQMNSTPEKAKYLNDVFRLLINILPGKSFVISNIVKAENIEIFIKCCCLFMSERPNHDYEFSNDYKLIIRRL